MRRMQIHEGVCNLWASVVSHSRENVMPGLGPPLSEKTLVCWADMGPYVIISGDLMGTWQSNSAVGPWVVRYHAKNRIYTQGNLSIWPASYDPGIRMPKDGAPNLRGAVSSYSFSFCPQKLLCGKKTFRPVSRWECRHSGQKDGRQQAR